MTPAAGNGSARNLIRVIAWPPRRTVGEITYQPNGSMLCLVNVDTTDREQAAHEVCALAEVAITEARRELRAGGLPFLYQSGVRFIAQAPDACCFRTPSEVLARKGGDCKQLTTWRIAELREAGINAKPRVIWLVATDGQGVKGFIAHMLLRLPDNNLEDPSVNLGMTSP